MEEPSAEDFAPQATPDDETLQVPNADVEAIASSLIAEGMGPASAKVLAEDYIMLWQLSESVDRLPFLRNRPRVDPERKRELLGALAAEGMEPTTREVVVDVHVWATELYHGMFAVGQSKVGRRFLKREGVSF